MISRKAFVKVMEAIVKNDDMETAINNVFRDYNNDSVIMNSSLEDAIINVIEEQFDDLDSDWLGYLCYERNYLRDYKLGDIEFADGSSPELNDWNDVYDFLVQCMNDKKSKE